MSSSFSRIVQIAVLGLLGSSALAACSSSSAEDIGVPEVPPEGAIQDYTLPLDEYIFDQSERALSEYAENLLVEDCMASNGYDWPIARRDVEAMSMSPVRSSSGRRLLTVEIAEQFGYHFPETLSPEVASADRALMDIELTPAMETTLTSCRVDEARNRLPLPDDNHRLAAVLANQALTDAAAEPEVVSAAERWRDCLAPQGIADLPPSPDGGDGMPPQSLQDSLGIDDPDSEPSLDEIRLAIADAECRESSGYAEELYAHEWSHQRKALVDNADELVAAQNTVEEYIAEARAVVNEYGT